MGGKSTVATLIFNIFPVFIDEYLQKTSYAAKNSLKSVRNFNIE